MANNREPSMASLLECPVCLEPFTDPRMLTGCFHTLCYKCLGDHIEHSSENGQCLCPVCRTSLPISEDGADAFPKNFFINNCLDVVDTGAGARSKTRSTSGSGQRKVCSNFEDGEECTASVQFCVDCCEYYCSTCSSVHRRLKITRNHEQIAVGDLTNEILRDAFSKSETPRCSKHKDKMLELYCSTCNCAVCPICCHITHQSHTFREMSDVDEDLKSELNDTVIALQRLIEDVKEHTDQVNQSNELVKDRTTTARETTRSFFKKIRELIDQKEKEVDQNMCKIRDDAETETNAKNKNLTLHNELLDSLRSFTHDLLHKGNIFNRLASLPDVRCHLLKMKCSTQGMVTDTANQIPSSTDLIADNIDTMTLERAITLDSSGFEEVRELKMIVQKCSITQAKVDHFLFLNVRKHSNEDDENGVSVSNYLGRNCRHT